MHVGCLETDTLTHFVQELFCHTLLYLFISKEVCQVIQISVNVIEFKIIVGHVQKLNFACMSIPLLFRWEKCEIIIFHVETNILFVVMKSVYICIYGGKVSISSLSH